VKKILQNKKKKNTILQRTFPLKAHGVECLIGVIPIGALPLFPLFENFIVMLVEPG
jgi:hypothetical protein